MVGKANGFFDKAMGPQVKVQWTSFNAGPAAIEALVRRRHRYDVCWPQPGD